MSPPTKELMKLVLEEKIAHGGHPVLRWMMDNIIIRTDPAGNIKPDKEKSTKKLTVRLQPLWFLTVQFAVAAILLLRFMMTGAFYLSDFRIFPLKSAILLREFPLIQLTLPLLYAII